MTEKSVAVEEGTTIVMITDIEGHHHQDVIIHLVVEEALGEIGLTLLMEEAPREGQREGINPVAPDDLFHSLDK